MSMERKGGTFVTDYVCKFLKELLRLMCFEIYIISVIACTWNCKAPCLVKVADFRPVVTEYGFIQSK